MVSSVTRDLTIILDRLRSAEGRSPLRYPASGGGAVQSLRALALLLVFSFHFAGFAVVHREDSLGIVLTGWALPLGSLGTNCFLVVSGALGWLSCQRREEPFRRFAWRRIRRLYPPYLATLLLYLALSILFPGQSKLPGDWADLFVYLLRNLVLLPGIFPERPIITVTWALTLILAFYLVIPGLRSGVQRVARNGQGEVALLAGVGAVWIVLCSLFPALPFRLVFLLAGCIVAASLSSAGPGWDESSRWSMLGGASLIIYVLTLSWTAAWFLQFLISAVGLMAITRACLCSRSGWIGRWPFVALGNMGYSFYLLHGLTIKFMFIVFLPRWAPDRAGWQMVLPTLILAMAASTILFRLVEQPGRWPWETPVPLAGGDPREARPALRAMAAKA